MIPSSSPTTFRAPSRPLKKAGKERLQRPLGGRIAGRRGWNAALALLVALAVPGCAPAPVVDQPSAGPELPLRSPAGAARYRVIDKDSLIYARVFRGGSMAKLGHNHVVAFGGVRGDVYVAGKAAGSLVDLVVPVSGAVVDPPELRGSQGKAFDTTISDQARDKTRRNMLGGKLLDAALHPYIVISSKAIEGGFQGPRVSLDITIGETTRAYTLPVSLRRDEGTLTASGRLELLQSDFGIEPYQVLGGALKVKDRVELVFEITAVRME